MKTSLTALAVLVAILGCSRGPSQADRVTELSAQEAELSRLHKELYDLERFTADTIFQMKKLEAERLALSRNIESDAGDKILDDQRKANMDRISTAYNEAKAVLEKRIALQKQIVANARQAAEQ